MLLAAVCGGLIVVPGQAQAAVTATASGSLGKAAVVVNGEAAQASPIAPCDADGPILQASSASTAVDAMTEFGEGRTSCARDTNGAASAEAIGQGFETSVLQRYGGPVIRMHAYTAGCATTANGSSGHMEATNLTGVTVPTD